MENISKTDQSYKTKAWLGSWRQRSSAIWSLATIGLVAGAVTGAITALAPVVAGAYALEVGVSLLLKTAAALAVTGMTTGLLVGGVVGSSSGAVSSVADEQERRQRARDEALGIEVPEIPPPPQKPRAKLFNFKVASVFAGLGVIAGMTMLSSSVDLLKFLPGLESIVTNAGGLGSGTGALAQTAAVTGMMGAFGGFFGFNVPEITLRTNKIYGNLLNGRALGTSWDKAPKAPAHEKQPKMKTPCIARPAEEGPAPEYQPLTTDYSDPALKATQANRKNAEGFANGITTARLAEEQAVAPTR